MRNTRFKSYISIVFISLFVWESAGSERILKTKELSHVITNGEESSYVMANEETTGRSTKYINASFSTHYTNYDVSKNLMTVFMFSYTFEPNQTWAVRLTTTSDRTNTNKYPVLFSVRQEKGISSWQIPMIFRNTYKYWNVSRTLCPFQNYPISQPVEEEQNIYVDVSSQSPDPVFFSLIASNLTNFLIQSGETKTLTISPSQPFYVQYTFPPDEDVILIHATSEDFSCAVISLQEIQCPVYDLDRNIEFSGYYQTMSRQAGITVSKSQDFKSGSFYIVFVLKPYDRDCSGYENIVPSGQTSREKIVNLKISPKITKNEYYIAIFGIFAIFALFYFLSIILAIVYLIKDIRTPSERSLLESQDVQRPLHSSQNPGYGTVSPSRNPFDSRLKDPCNSFDDASGSVDTRSLDDDDSLDETDVDMLDDADHEKDVFRTKTFLFVADLARKKQKKLSKKSALYSRNILIIAIFYGIPVVQLVYTYQKVLHVTGDQDICYYNFLCAHPFYVFSDFNHVFSNVGYLLLGILFIGLVWRRDIMHKRSANVNPRLEKYFGIPRHNGLYYAMGLALIMEGILSGSYHACPNFSNFQFDTTFMYIIASLCMLKIYQSRHPDINANSHSSCLVFAIVVLIGVIGVFDGGSPYFWVAFCALEALCCLLLSIQVYYMGRWRLNWGIFKRIYLTLRNDLCTHFTRPMYPDRLMLLLIANLANWALLAYGLVVQLRDFGTFLLAIFIINLLLYITFYIIMKLRYHEKILPQPRLYILLACVTWGAAMYFFLHKNVSWQQTPAQSREKNHPCLVLHFYDVHDIWHFLSSAALFFSFMVLLTLDDDLIYVPRERIPVF